MEEDLILQIVGVGRPVRLILGCSLYSKLRGPRLVRGRLVGHTPAAENQQRRERGAVSRTSRAAHNAKLAGIKRTRKPSLTERYRVGPKPVPTP